MAAVRRPRTPAGLSDVATAVDQFLQAHFPKTSRFLIACSGGPDSVALAHAVAEIAAQRRLSPVLGHVNHRLRGRSSDADQVFVEKLGARLGFPVDSALRPISRQAGNLEEKARDARYSALCAMARQHRAPVILIAHTEDDQAETLLINILRGAGTDGLAGMPAVRPGAKGVTIARPLLRLARGAVHAYLRARGAFRLDKSNADPRFFRNYVRLALFPPLESRSPGFQQRLARLAVLARDEAAVLDGLADAALAETGRKYRRGWLIDQAALSRVPAAIQRRVLRKAAGIDVLRFDGVEKLRLWMDSPPTNGRVWQLRKGWSVERLSKSSGSPSSALFWFRHTPPKKER